MSGRAVPGRRACLAALAGCALGAQAAPPVARPHPGPGPVQPPLPAPDLSLLGSSGQPLDLRKLLIGRTTALNLMFTGCSATCPITGAVYGAAQRRLHQAPARLALFSLSIDPLGDDPAAVRQWLQRFEADSRRWTAGILRPRDVDRFLEFVEGRRSGVDNHTSQVYVFNRRAELVFRTLDLPSAEQIVEALQGVDRMG